MELDLGMLQHDTRNAHANAQSPLLTNKKVWSRRYFARDPGSVTQARQLQCDTAGCFRFHSPDIDVRD